ncbi:MAG: glycosyltransferase [Terriglobales bacterium]|jgi:colanic acid/amylovoran biosynthesis glycosyltransferase
MNLTRNRLIVLHYSAVWLAPTEIWLFDQLTQQPQWIENHVVCEAIRNLDRFPVPNLHCFSEARTLRWFWDKSLRKARIRSYLGYLVTQAHRIKPQIVHSHFGNVGWSNHRAVRRLGLPHIVTFYGLDVNHLPMVDTRWRGRYQELFSSVDRVLCEGPHMARCIVELGCPQNKVCVHHLGVRIDQLPYCPRRWRRGMPLRILIAATFREKKGIPYALAALGALPPDIALEITIIGDAGPEPGSQAEKARILAALERHNLLPCTRLLGFRTYEELMKEAYRHHIFLSPSITASDGDTEGGAPVGILHMAASGMPIVTTRHCDIPNVLPPSVDIAEERDIQGLVGRLCSLIDRAENWEPELAQARRHVETNFNAHMQGLKLAAIYAEIAGAPRRSSKHPVVLVS